MSPKEVGMSRDYENLSARETASRLLENMPDDASYEDIIRQLRILQSIDWTVRDIEIGGFAGEAVVKSAREELEHGSRRAAYHQPLVLRSAPLFNWQTLAERSDEDPLIRKATWIY